MLAPTLENAILWTVSAEVLNRKGPLKCHFLSIFNGVSLVQYYEQYSLTILWGITLGSHDKALRNGKGITPRNGREMSLHSIFKELPTPSPPKKSILFQYLVDKIVLKYIVNRTISSFTSVWKKQGQRQNHHTVNLTLRFPERTFNNFKIWSAPNEEEHEFFRRLN